jgi:hypothetical protein
MLLEGKRTLEDLVHEGVDLVLKREHQLDADRQVLRERPVDVVDCERCDL